MIEFKAECGHTVRAKDEEAGGVVRCSYCGRQANVPQPQDEALDSLFDELQRAPDLAVATGPKLRARRRFLKKRRPGAFNPFPIILRMCYAALLVSIVIIVVNKFLIPVWKGGRSASVTASKPAEVQPKRQRATSSEAPKPADKGLLNRSQTAGLYVVSTPPGATVYCITGTDASPGGRIHRLGGCIVHGSAGSPQRVSDGTYIVEVAFPWNDQALKRYHGYTEFRRALERAPENQRNKLVEEFFIPDEASVVMFDQSDEQKYIVRQYRGIEVRDGRSNGVRSLFLPKIATPDDGFSIEELVVNYMPETHNYAFDDRHVCEELEYYGVREVDQPWMIQALSRIGIMPYVTPAKRVMVFKIGIEDGVFSAKAIRDAGK